MTKELMDRRGYKSKDSMNKSSYEIGDYQVK